MWLLRRPVNNWTNFYGRSMLFTPSDRLDSIFIKNWMLIFFDHQLQASPRSTNANDGHPRKPHHHPLLACDPRDHHHRRRHSDRSSLVIFFRPLFVYSWFFIKHEYLWQFILIKFIPRRRLHRFLVSSPDQVDDRYSNSHTNMNILFQTRCNSLANFDISILMAVVLYETFKYPHVDVIALRVTDARHKNLPPVLETSKRTLWGFSENQFPNPTRSLNATDVRSNWSIIVIWRAFSIHGVARGWTWSRQCKRHFGHPNDRRSEWKPFLRDHFY